jgi:hypothetical protein
MLLDLFIYCSQRKPKKNSCPCKRYGCLWRLIGHDAKLCSGIGLVTGQMYAWKHGKILLDAVYRRDILPFQIRWGGACGQRMSRVLFSAYCFLGQ